MDEILFLAHMRAFNRRNLGKFPRCRMSLSVKSRIQSQQSVSQRLYLSFPSLTYGFILIASHCHIFYGWNLVAAQVELVQV